MITKYVIITPARNEESFVAGVISSMIEQSMQPVRWIIVSDGSTDRTDSIVEKCLEAHPWIELVRLPPHPDRHFAAKVHAFQAGYKVVSSLDFDVIGNVDADITFGPDQFEFLMSKFAADPQLGVAGTAFVEHGQSYNYELSGTDHVSGPCQLFRRSCYDAIGGYTPLKDGGIDWFAVLKARMYGWRTRTFTERIFVHHRVMGTAVRNRFSAGFRRGMKDYFMGGHPLWEFFRASFQMTRKPLVVGGLVLLFGFAWAWICGIEMQIPDEMVEFHRAEQMERLRRILGHVAACFKK